MKRCFRRLSAANIYEVANYIKLLNICENYDAMNFSQGKATRKAEGGANAEGFFG